MPSFTPTVMAWVERPDRTKHRELHSSTGTGFCSAARYTSLLTGCAKEPERHPSCFSCWEAMTCWWFAVQLQHSRSLSTFAGSWSASQTDRGTKFHLTLGIGVVFSKPTVPFHRLHEVAENLAASAKRRFRGFMEEGRGSVADWAVYTTAWVDDPAETRRRNWVCGSGDNRRVLSLRPLRVLGDALSSVEGLLRATGSLAEAPRSQLRYLVDQLHRGKAPSELAFTEMSKKAREALKDAGISEVWSRSGGGRPYLTSVLDLVEVFEIARLGRFDREKESANVEA